jgi:hypothetical protein
MNDQPNSEIEAKSDVKWTGKHVFSENIEFSSKQKFNFNQINLPLKSNNSVLVSQDNTPYLIQATEEATYLQFDGNVFSFNPLALSPNMQGVLEINNGGTGWHKLPLDGLVHLKSKKLQSIQPQENKVLSFQNQEYTWIDINSNIEAVINANKLLNQLNFKSEIFDINENGIQFNVDTEEEKVPFFISFNDLKNILEAKNDPTVLSSDIKGVISFLQGGFGFNTIERGDILYSSVNNSINKLSAYNQENKVLTVKNGIPSWQDIDVKVELQKQFSDVTFIKEKNARLYFDGTKSFEIAHIDSDINGNAAGLSRTLQIEKGGTGLDLSQAPLGSALYIGFDKDKLYYINPGEKGQVLVSNGADKVPAYQYPVNKIKSKDDYIISTNDKDVVNIELNTSVDYAWNCKHTFDNAKVQNNLETKIISFENNSSKQNQNSQMFMRSDELFFVKNGQEVCLSSPAQASKECHVVKVCDNAFLKENIINPHNIMLPFTNTKAQQEDVWKIKRVDIYCHTPPQEDIEIDLVCDRFSILNEKIAVEAFVNKASSFNFSKNLFHSGEMIFIKTRELYGADNFTIWAVIEKN